MKNKHWYVGWAGQIRYAYQISEKQAKLYCFGIDSPSMKIVQLPKSPRYMSAALKQTYQAQVHTQLVGMICIEN